MKPFKDGEVAPDAADEPFGRYAEIIILEGVEAIAYGIEFARCGVAIIFIDADERRDAGAAHEFVLISIDKVGQHVLVVQHGIDAEILSSLETEITQHIVAAIPGAYEGTCLVGVARAEVVAGAFAATVDGKVGIVGEARLPTGFPGTGYQHRGVWCRG